jgi:hypothetical protein
MRVLFYRERLMGSPGLARPGDERLLARITPAIKSALEVAFIVDFRAAT